MRIFILTLQFLTRIPIYKELQSTDEDFAKGVVFFPIVGLIVGAFNLTVLIASSKILGGIFPIICCLIAGTVITGGFHTDGLADTCDGIFSSRTRERMLEIMRDSRIGTMGTIAIFFDYLMRLSLLAMLTGRGLHYAVLLSPVAAKTLMVLLMKTSVYARSGNGLGGLYLEKQTMGATVLAAAIGLAIMSGFSGIWGIVAFGICAVFCFLYRSFIYIKLQGMTGDTLGAANEFLEISFVLIMAIMAGRGII
ncbi:MAG TPA: adenosylcobinamide-GDP ribazoletransferase [Bacillota bacterium]|nr:adenosylcobinamide-GDP ribazoletransferase [Bacillota bacterium]HOR86410.1 adenosylcobinamide-GDP ribazoletransferase [Bacillota bacterium]HPL54451.1 adenosylcobinamide-GDP ribazoletransferase [Bacillota bacterium]